MRYEYCPKCGSKLTAKDAGDDGAVPYCVACRKYWFDTFSHCVIVMVYNEFNEIVLCAQPYLSNTYRNFTSGYILPTESAEEAALREVKEELGITPETLEYVGSCWYPEGDMLMTAFMAYSPKCEFNLSGEVASAEWVSLEDAPKTMFPEKPGNAMWILYYHLKRVKNL